MADTILKLSADSGAQIRYTLDKSEPTQDSTLYSSQVSIPEGAILKAKSFKSGCLPSDTMVYRNQTPFWNFVDKGSFSNKTGTPKWSFFNENDNYYYTYFGNNCFSKSLDLLNWEDLESSSLLDSIQNPYSQIILCGNKYFLFSGTSSFYIYSSTDLINWKQSKNYSVDYKINYFQIYFINNTYILNVYCSDNGGELFTSKDGINFSLLNIPERTSGYLGSFVKDNMFYVYYGRYSSATIRYTKDFQSWSSETSLDFKSIGNAVSNNTYTNIPCLRIDSVNGYFLFYGWCYSNTYSGNGYKFIVRSKNIDASASELVFSEYIPDNGRDPSYSDITENDASFFDGLNIFHIYFVNFNKTWTHASWIIWGIDPNSTYFSSEDSFDYFTLKKGNIIFNKNSGSLYRLYNSHLYELQQ